MPRSPLWNCVNSIVQPLNSISFIQLRRSTWGTRVNAPLGYTSSAGNSHCNPTTTTTTTTLISEDFVKYYRSTAEFNLVHSTASLNLGDPYKRAFSLHEIRGQLTLQPPPP